MTLRFAGREHLDLTHLAGLYDDAGWSGRCTDLGAMLDGSRFVVSVWEQETLVGFGRAFSDGVTSAYLTDLMVRSDHRRRGIACEIVARLIDEMRTLLHSPVMFDRGLHALAILVVLSSSVAIAQDTRGRATAIEGRLIAPCCWTQTLDIHDSPSARELRDEILARVLRGESSEAIEADLTHRYGERIRAVPPGTDWRNVGPVLTALAMLLGALGLVSMVRRSRSPSVPSAPAAIERTALDDRLDEELRRFD